jgi:hypothetical protein
MRLLSLLTVMAGFGVQAPSCLYDIEGRAAATTTAVTSQTPHAAANADEASHRTGLTPGRQQAHLEEAEPRPLPYMREDCHVELSTSAAAAPAATAVTGASTLRPTMSMRARSAPRCPSADRPHTPVTLIEAGVARR